MIAVESAFTRFTAVPLCFLEGFEVEVIGMNRGEAVVQADYDKPFVVPLDRFDAEDRIRIRRQAEKDRVA